VGLWVTVTRMVFVILAGGLGTRMAPATAPKPLTPIHGRPSLAYALGALAPRVSELIFIYGAHLQPFNFEEVVANLFPGTACRFACVPFGTRGAVETALAGLLTLALPPDTPLVFLDNDNVYPEALAARAAPRAAFLGFDFDHSDSTAMSFMQCSPSGAVTAFAEKRRISSQICTGVYGFASSAQFLLWARHTLQHGPFPNNEIYMSSVFVNMIAAGEAIESHAVPIVGLGTAALAEAFVAAHPAAGQLRVSFHLDGTLVTPPRIPGDLNSVRPVEANCALARALRAAGHAVLVTTHREPGTPAWAAALASLAQLGLDPLGGLQHVPECDVRVDGAGLNPYLQSPRAAGLPFGRALPAPGAPLPVPNALPPRASTVVLRSDGAAVLKMGSCARLGGELRFYQVLAALAPAQPALAPLFPRLLGYATLGSGCEAQQEIALEYIKGVPLASLFAAQLLEAYHLALVLDALRALHCAGAGGGSSSGGTEGAGSTAAEDLAQLQASGLSPAVLEAVQGLAAAPSAPGAVRTPLIHGDASFANMVLTSTNRLVLLDPQGGAAPTAASGAGGEGGAEVGQGALGGDPVRDYAQVVQSLLGVDEIVHELPSVPHAYRVRMLTAFTALLRAQGVPPPRVLDVCILLTASRTLHTHRGSERACERLRILVGALLGHAASEENAQLTAVLKRL
jgi:hypothetical protein